MRTTYTMAAAAAHDRTGYTTGALRAGRGNPIGALALTFGALALTLAALGANAEITQDCIIEGTVDMRRAEQLGQPYYVSFRDIRRGSEANCTMNRRSKSRRVQFVDTPTPRADGIESAVHGSKVRYRYIERDGQPGQWQLIDVRDPRGS